MIHKHVTPWSVTLACMLLVSSGTAMAQRAYLIVDRTTGAAEATSSAAIPVHGYSITSTSGLLDVEAWSSLQEQGAAGWTEANPNANQLTEFTLEPGGLQPGTNVGLGALFTVGAATLPSEEDLQFQVTVPASDPTVPGDVINGVVVYTGPSSVPTITVNRESGNIELTNTGGFPVDAYSISSESGLLDPAGMAEVPGFRASNPTANLVTGLNFEGSASFPATVNLGNVFKADGVVGIENEDLTFAYTVPGNTEEFTGVVEYTGAVNDLVLQVNELTGAASIQHMSPNVGAVEITGYSILSDGGSLDSSAWNKIGGNFREANPGDSALAEINLTGGMMFANGTSHALGNIFAGSSRDLVFEYSTPDTDIAFGSVEYVFGDSVPSGPTCADLRDSRLPGDADGSGDVGFLDFLTLANNFGGPGGFEDGDFDCSGDIGFLDFLTLANNFGASAAADTASVPEPSTCLLAGMAMLMGLTFRRKR